MDEVVTNDAAALLTKVSSEDARILESLAIAPRLGSIVKVVYKQRGNKEAGVAQANAVEEIPAGANRTEWEPYVMLAYGIKLGSSRALVESGQEIFKGQNIFPAGVLGEPMGRWDPESSVVDSLRLYAYRHLFDHSKLYAIRNVSLLPSACPAPAGIVFQNTAQLVQLVEDFPLNLYLLSRIPQWFAAKVLRTSIVEDLFTTWVKRNLVLIPIPAKRSSVDIAAIRVAGEAVVARDKDLANAHRHVEQLINDSPKVSLYDLFAKNDPLVAGADLSNAASETVVSVVNEEGEEIVTDGLLFRIKIPNASLRKYLVYKLQRLIEDEEDVYFDAATLGLIQVPVELRAVVAAIDQMRSTDSTSGLQDALMELDHVVADLFGMPQNDLKYITTAMTTDGFLRQLRPSYEHTGLRIQPYADHSQGDRYS
jgi:hypothetical protein